MHPFMVAFSCVQARGRVRCVYTYVVYHTPCLCGLPVSSWYTTLEKNAPVSCMDLFSNPGRWRHICQSGCEDRIYCLMASAQDGDCEEDGTQGRPTLPEGTFAAARKEEGAPRVATGERRRRRTEPGEDKASYLRKDSNVMHMELVWNADDLAPWTDCRC